MDAHAVTAPSRQAPAIGLSRKNPEFGTLRIIYSIFSFLPTHFLARTGPSILKET
jgi:hypothetical protein